MTSPAMHSTDNDGDEEQVAGAAPRPSTGGTVSGLTAGAVVPSSLVPPPQTSARLSISKSDAPTSRTERQ